jgi:hypothetical protein
VGSGERIQIDVKTSPSALASVKHRRQFFAFGNESNGKRVNAVACVFITKAFAFKDVT